MSVASSPVIVQTKFSLEAIALMNQLIPQAVQRAIELAKNDTKQYAKSDISNVPVDTGRLRASFDIATTPYFLVMKWSAIDPRSGYDYAMVQDVGRKNMVGKFYSEVTKFYAQQFLVQRLREELEAMQGVAR